MTVSKNSRLMDAYGQLSTEVRCLIQLAAVYYCGINRTDLVKLAAKYGWKDSSGRELDYKQLRPDITKAFDRGILVNDGNGSKLVINAEILDTLVQQSVLSGQFPALVETVQKDDQSPQIGYYLSRSTPNAATIRDARIAFYSGNTEYFSDVPIHGPPPIKGTRQAIGVLTPFNVDVFQKLPSAIKMAFLADALQATVINGIGEPELIEIARKLVAQTEPLDADFVASLVDTFFAIGDIDALKRLDKVMDLGCPQAVGCAAILKGQYDEALAHFEVALKLQTKGSKRKAAIRNLPGILYVCLLLRTLDAASRKRAVQMIGIIQSDWPFGQRQIGDLLSQAQSHQLVPNQKPLFKYLIYGWDSELVPLFAAYLWQWIAPEQKALMKAKPIAEAAELYRELGYAFFESEYLMAISNMTAENANACAEKSAQIHQARGTVSLFGLIAPEPAWKKSLQALQLLIDQQSPSSAGGAAQSDERMIWELQGASARLQVRPYIQKISKSGTWTKGRPVSLERLYQQVSDSDEFGFLTDQDIAICRCIEETVDTSNYYHEVSYNFEPLRLARALVGHPLVFAEGDRSQPIDVNLREPQLIVEKKSKNNVSLRFDTDLPSGEGLIVAKDGPHKLNVTICSSKHRQIAAVIGNRLTIPKAGLPMVQKLLGSLGDLVAIQSEIDSEGGSAAEVSADALPHLHLSQFQAGMRAEFFVHLFGQTGPAMHPGQGAANVFASLDGRSANATRDLKREFSEADKIVQSCSALAEQTGDQSDATHWMFEFPTAWEALEFSLQIGPLVEKNSVVVHWPKGKSLRVVGEASPGKLRINLKRDRDWFAASGKLQVPGQDAIDMMKLIELVQASPSRFIQLDDGQFLALTDKFRERIESLALYSNHQKNKLRFAPVQAAVLEDIAETFDVKADTHWKTHLKRIRAADDLQPEVPSTFQAEMRDYQLEGYRWMTRLAAWGAGACLADDMGLGKTIQALALLADRGKDGPALVVAPTSVGFNWVSEATRFAPTLTTRLFGQGDRDETLAKLGPHDLVICSYGLLHSEADRLQKIAWYTVALDEAQAIKNYETKRSQAAMGLQAEFRMILTGTPLENHLGELWNLFEFINPGLLGSQTTFRDRFAVPIERDGDRATRQQLKRLVRPFILRRTKSEVLEELPSRTEVTLQVDFSPEEAAFYEALRQRAIEKLAEASEDNKQSMQVLAEIMRLRRACCHPKLVVEDSDLPSSKLELFTKTIADLRDGEHKVLVFSQFVGQLQILRQRLNEMEVPYQYLDGSTPAKQRQASVEAFQAGQGDVFLISLKAGGTGLNLTAADYVIHMDPWWNPAVEDQASDRAHRLGQTRPVTIYRFVTQGTIEEQIVELHRSKRDLADSLLEGTDISGKLTTAELIKMINS